MPAAQILLDRTIALSYLVLLATGQLVMVCSIIFHSRSQFLQISTNVQIKPPPMPTVQTPLDHIIAPVCPDLLAMVQLVVSFLHKLSMLYLK